MENPEIINFPPDAFRGPALGRATARLLRIHVAQTEDMEMRTYDFAPLGRSSVGFDRLFDLINNAHLSEADDTYPPYDIVRTGSDSFRISLAVAGFAPENLKIIAQQNLLTGPARSPKARIRNICSRAYPDALSSESSASPTTSRWNARIALTGCSRSTLSVGYRTR
jgi:hypothetical protein